MLIMVKVTNSYSLLTILLVTVLGLTPVTSVSATDLASVAPGVFITEVQTSNLTAKQEFIELYNATDQAIDLADSDGSQKRVWKLYYFNSTKLAAPGFDWATTIPTSIKALTGSVGPHEFYLLSAKDYLPSNIVADQIFTDFLANDDGALRLVSVDTAIDPVTGLPSETITGHDQVGWRASVALGDSFVRPHTAYGSLQRQMDNEGNYSDEAGVLGDFSGTPVITPKAAWQFVDEVEPEVPVEVPEEPVVDPEDAEPVDTTDPTREGEVVPEEPTGESGEVTPPPTTPTVTLLSPQITELLPNPAAPASDAADEFVEIYNPNTVPLDLQDYTLETGANNTYRFTFNEVIIPAQSYIVVTSGASPLSLANSGGHARLLDPSGAVISQSDEYADAAEGESWAFVDGNWRWTITPTSAAANTFTVAPPPPVKSLVAKSITSKPKAAAKPKVLSASSTAAKKPAATKAAAKTVANAQANDELPETPPMIHPGVLAAAGLLALGYAAYEYRQDIANRYYQLRRYRAARRAARSSLAGR